MIIFKKIDKWILSTFSSIILFLLLISVFGAGAMVFFVAPIMFFTDLTNQNLPSMIQDLLIWIFAIYWAKMWLKLVTHLQKEEKHI